MLLCSDASKAWRHLAVSLSKNVSRNGARRRLPTSTILQRRQRRQFTIAVTAHNAEVIAKCGEQDGIKPIDRRFVATTNDELPHRCAAQSNEPRTSLQPRRVRGRRADRKGAETPTRVIRFHNSLGKNPAVTSSKPQAGVGEPGILSIIRRCPSDKGRGVGSKSLDIKYDKATDGLIRSKENTAAAAESEHSTVNFYRVTGQVPAKGPPDSLESHDSTRESGIRRRNAKVQNARSVLYGRPRKFPIASPVFTAVNAPETSKKQRTSLEVLDQFLLHDFDQILALLMDATPSLALENQARQMDIDDKYWQMEESDDVEELDGLRDLLDDITYAASQAQAPIREIWKGSHGFVRGTALLERPPALSKRGLNSYIRRLVAPEAPKSGANQNVSYGKPGTPVTQELMSILTDEHLTPRVTNSTLSLVFFYLYREEDYETLFQLYRHLKGKSYSFDNLNFNVLLRSAAWEPSSLNLLPILRHMLESGLEPTSDTWFTFYQLVSRKYSTGSKSRRQIVISAMGQQGLLQEGDTIKEAVAIALDWRIPNNQAKKALTGTGDGVDSIRS